MAARPDAARLARLDSAIVSVWAGLSLVMRRVLGEYPDTADPSSAFTGIVQMTPAKMLWLPLLFYAGILPLAILLFHRLYAGRRRAWMRLGSAAAALAFVLYAIGLCLNVVQAAAASAYLRSAPAATAGDILERFDLLWRVDQGLGIAVLILLAGWMAAVSLAAPRPGFAAWPRWFSMAGLAAALITVGSGLFDLIAHGALGALDGGDAIIFVHLWIGLAGTLVWQQAGAGKGAA